MHHVYVGGGQAMCKLFSFPWQQTAPQLRDNRTDAERPPQSDRVSSASHHWPHQGLPLSDPQRWAATFIAHVAVYDSTKNYVHVTFILEQFLCFFPIYKIKAQIWHYLFYFNIWKVVHNRWTYNHLSFHWQHSDAMSWLISVNNTFYCTKPGNLRLVLEWS